jgi:hypothetical protein
MRPSWIEFRVPFVIIYFGVKWFVYEPEIFIASQPWIDGPYYPNCDSELEEKKEGLFLKRDLWACQLCKENYDKPKGNLKNQVEKKFLERFTKKDDV